MTFNDLQDFYDVVRVSYMIGGHPSRLQMLMLLVQVQYLFLSVFQLN